VNEDNKAEQFSIEARELTKMYVKFTAVDELDLRIERGEIYGLLGPNGAGKTTTIKMLCGLLKPTSGEARLLDRTLPDRGVASMLGYMPQDTAIYPGITVRQNIRFFGQVFGLGKNEIAERERELLEFIDLEKWRDVLVAKLSGGMMHRVSLPARSSTGRRSSSLMSLRSGSIPSSAPRFGNTSRSWSVRAPPSSSPLTTWMRPATATGWGS